MTVVVVLGGSFAGLQVALELSGRVEVVLVDPRDYWEFTPSIHTALCGDRDPSQLLTPLDGFLAKVKFVQAAATRVGEKSVFLSNGQEVGFDFLVVATGCSYPEPVRAIEPTREKRLAALDAARARLRNKKVVVVGGGAVGVEVAGELGSNCILATNARELVPDCPEATRTKALSTLLAMGVRVVLECRVAEGEEGKCELRTKDGVVETIEGVECLWCFGGKPNASFMPPELLDARGFVKIDEGSRRCTPTIYAVGDVAAKPDAQRLASYAHLEGEYVAHHILSSSSSEGGNNNTAPYAPPPRFVALSFGPTNGAFVYDATPLPIPGRAIPYLKALIERWFIRLLPMPYAILKLLPGDPKARAWAKKQHKSTPAVAVATT
ncbi:hypothetical protein CTAYLR_003324 [Chrysophaeum taylorii]|uniref:FAD/NAD(P)-binding domain-containing protein n=1 Tax=Chrysophaeum taylorii TaxID=2483200 RepID=A0AAD7UI97_9STRA|nr:hypothetical protein CTAYLR_003324 [Chrysophaeum taylorii]